MNKLLSYVFVVNKDVFKIFKILCQYSINNKSYTVKLFCFIFLLIRELEFRNHSFIYNN